MMFKWNTSLEFVNEEVNNPGKMISFLVFFGVLLFGSFSLAFNEDIEIPLLHQMVLIAVVIIVHEMVHYFSVPSCFRRESYITFIPKFMGAVTVIPKFRELSMYRRVTIFLMPFLLLSILAFILSITLFEGYWWFKYTVWASFYNAAFSLMDIYMVIVMVLGHDRL